MATPTQEERRLATFLTRVYNNVKRDLGIQLKGGLTITWTDIQTLYRKRTDDFIRSTVAEMYTLAAKKTVEKSMKLPFFPTQSDDHEIRKLTTKYQEWFWQGMENEIVKKTAFTYDPVTTVKPPMTERQLIQSLKDTFIDRMVASVQSEVAATAVISKAKQVLLGTGALPNQSRAIPKPKKLFDNRLRIRGLSSPFKSAALTTQGPKLVWKSENDAAVCNICAPLDGREFDINDPFVTTPIQDTHANCRCELELVEAEQEGGFGIDLLYPFYIFGTTMEEKRRRRRLIEEEE